MKYFEVQYYKQMNSGRWLKGRVRNLSMYEALTYASMIKDLLNTKFVRITPQKGN